VFLTHILGYNGLNQSLLDELNRRNIPLIEDVCEIARATFGGRKLGTYGLMSNFSFYYAHHLTPSKVAWYARTTSICMKSSACSGHMAWCAKSTSEKIKQS